MLDQLALALVEPPAAVSFMTFNVCKSSGCGNSPSWNVRKYRIVNVLNAAKPDIVAVQEATDWRVHGRTTQWEEIQSLSSPYVAPVISVDTCETNNCDHTARLLYNSTTVEQAGPAGSIRMRDIADGLSHGSQDRQVTWAYLSHMGQTVLVISVHTDNAKTAVGEQDRILFGRAVGPWADQLNVQHGMNVPVVIMGDFNSYDARQPQGIQTQLDNTGWVDSYNAPDKTNTHYSTVNYTPDTRQWQGWPERPRYFNNTATRIDYIFGRGGIVWQNYEVFLRTQGGKFDHDYQASDHQPVLATAVLTPQ